MLYPAYRNLCMTCLPARWAQEALLQYGWIHRYLGKPEVKAVTLYGVTFPNRLGVAAGLDRTGSKVPLFSGMGFGHVEVGTVTDSPQSGEGYMRFAMRERSIQNRMGSPNLGADRVGRNIPSKGEMRYLGYEPCPVGVSIGVPKTASPGEEHIYLSRAIESPYLDADYFTLNLSTPNTPGVRSLLVPDRLRPLLTQVMDFIRRGGPHFANRTKPVFLKVSGDEPGSDIVRTAATALNCGVRGIVAVNTTIHAPLNRSLGRVEGGFSGPHVRERALRTVTLLRRELGDDPVIVGVGGVFGGGDAKRLVDAGADLVQVYTGLLYQGPSLVREVLTALEPDEP